ncbi:MAG: Thiamin-phosphate pyrophosphorylase (EC [uncultured Sulfurovum sp.]|uniref:Thiamine-phosphate synthase n=1 Tax=uncultured Sulfurovum sp. TaxID=269237 RepID=A0A6S6U5C2_9BACT|nr:MAG: Thiamin-phosphate pyrophosphorylase (EC [uncultured Sulfurovum sp.]
MGKHPSIYKEKTMKFKDCGHTPLGLYPLVDRANKLETLYSLGITTAQLRIKDLQDQALENEIIQAIQISKKYNARFFINDYWQLAIKHKAYGIHLGQEDLIETDLQAIHKAGIRLGVSTHTTKEIEMALEIEPSYLAIGPIFHTHSKIVNYDTVGIDELTKWSSNVPYPIVAIGGINLVNIQKVINITTISGIAMISEFLEDGNISQKKTKKLLKIFS